MYISKAMYELKKPKMLQRRKSRVVMPRKFNDSKYETTASVLMCRLRHGLAIVRIPITISSETESRNSEIKYGNI